MAKRLHLQALARSELSTLRAKIRDLSLAARIHQRYRIIDLARQGYRPGSGRARRLSLHRGL